MSPTWTIAADAFAPFDADFLKPNSDDGLAQPLAVSPQDSMILATGARLLPVR